MVMKPGQFQRSQRSCQDLYWTSAAVHNLLFSVDIHCINYGCNSFGNVCYSCPPRKRAKFERSSILFFLLFLFLIFLPFFLSREESCNTGQCYVYRQGQKKGKKRSGKRFLGLIICITPCYLWLNWKDIRFITLRKYFNYHSK